VGAALTHAVSRTDILTEGRTD